LWLKQSDWLSEALDNSPAIYRWVTEMANSSVLKGRLRVPFVLMVAIQPSFQDLQYFY